MKRTPFKRGTQLGRSRPINPVSRTKKRRREQAAGESMAELRPVLWGRCGGHCERCRRTLGFVTFDAHHRKFRSRGGLDRIENLTALCGDCHRWVHRFSAKAIETGFAVLATEDPALIPLRTVPNGPGVYLTTEGTYTRKEPA